MIIDSAAYVDGKRLDVDTSCIPTSGMLPPSMAEAEFDETDAAPGWDAPEGSSGWVCGCPTWPSSANGATRSNIDEVDPAAVLAPHARPRAAP